MYSRVKQIRLVLQARASRSSNQNATCTSIDKAFSGQAMVCRNKVTIFAYIPKRDYKSTAR